MIMHHSGLFRVSDDLMTQGEHWFNNNYHFLHYATLKKQNLKVSRRAKTSNICGRKQSCCCSQWRGFGPIRLIYKPEPIHESVISNLPLRDTIHYWLLFGIVNASILATMTWLQLWNKQLVEVKTTDSPNSSNSTAWSVTSRDDFSPNLLNLITFCT